MKNMMTKLKKMLTNNIAIKIISVIIAFIIWLAVVNVSDPEKTVIIYNVPITITDEEAVTDLNMVYSLDSDDAVDVTVSGKRSVVSKLTADDFIATASLAELSKVNAVPVEVAVKNSSSANSDVDIVSQSVQTVSITTEGIESEDYDIEVEFSGSTARGYTVGDYSLSQNTVTVTAPTSVQKQISRVVAECDLDDTDTDISQKCRVRLYDEDGEIIKGSDIELSFKKVTVYASILQEKEVTINVTATGNPADGYETGDITISQDTVRLVGREGVLNGIEQIDVTDGVGVSGATGDVTTEIDLTQYLPGGVAIDGDSHISVTVEIEELETKTFTISADDIDINNVAYGLTCTISTKSVKVSLRGEKDVIDDISADDISVSIDLDGVEEGTSRVDVECDIPDGVELVSSGRVKVRLK